MGGRGQERLQNFEGKGKFGCARKKKKDKLVEERSFSPRIYWNFGAGDAGRSARMEKYEKNPGRKYQVSCGRQKSCDQVHRINQNPRKRKRKGKI